MLLGTNLPNICNDVKHLLSEKLKEATYCFCSINNNYSDYTDCENCCCCYWHFPVNFTALLNNYQDNEHECFLKIVLTFNQNEFETKILHCHAKVIRHLETFQILSNCSHKLQCILLGFYMVEPRNPV